MGDPPTDPAEKSEDAVPPPNVGTPAETLLDAVPYGIYSLDREGYLVAVNDALIDLTGYDRDTVLGEHISRFLDVEDVVRAETAIRDQILDGTQDAVHLSIPVVTRTGDTVPCKVCFSGLWRDGEFCGTVGVVREVESPDTAAEIQATGEHRQAFDALAEASADGIIMLDNDSVIRYANPAVERILGYPSEELVGGSKMQIIPERLRDVHAEALQRYLQTGEKHIDWTYVELPGLHKDGHEVPLAISLNEFTYDGEHYFVGTFRDISTRKDIERELKQQNERLDRFASMLAHELRNPLQIAQIYLDFVDDEDDDAPIGQIADALRRIDELIDVLLVLARNENEVGDREAVDLTKVVAEAWGNTDTGKAEVEVATNQTLRVNPAHLQQVLENLFRNAVEHSEGSVTVRVGTLDDGFYVEDTGPGIDESERTAVVEAGYTSDEGGTGLGLTFVAELADAYGWDFSITESTEGGARFEFRDVEFVADDAQ
ncbi:PAS domain S-box protein [Halorussus aquaticus]|uniref:histidine kinase n=1 Tax=Halorussus aquaticus TaxID=2953748 RepID=A0ABD5PYI2_9EURY|nr:PAS domain S-box protein [Halorussus aquaticus]